MINVIKNEMLDQMLFQSELAARMKGNTKTRAKDLSNILKYKREPGIQLLEEIAQGLGCEWQLVEKAKVTKDYLIFNRGTPESPGIYEVHPYVDGKPDFSGIYYHADLKHIRKKLTEKGFMCVGLGDYNDPLVLEVWTGEAMHPMEVL